MTADERPPIPASQLAIDRATLGLNRPGAGQRRDEGGSPDTEALRRLIEEMRRADALDPDRRPDVRIGEFTVEGARVPLSLVAPLQTLTRMEAAVMRFLGWGRANGDIGLLLHVNESTVRTHLNNAVQKLELDGVRQLNCVAGLLFHPID